MIEATPPLKRSSTAAGFDAPNPNKLRITSVHHHRLHWKQPQRKPHPCPSQNEEAVRSSLSRSIGLALRAIGFKYAEPVALDSFGSEVEEFMAHFLAQVRLSMASCRRTQTTPLDYLEALRAHQLTLRSLLPHLDPPVSPADSQIPSSLDTIDVDEKLSTASLESISNGSLDRSVIPYIPRHFPSFPSKHTYKATPNFTSREIDPKKIRERATEEGRLGEEALRRLVGAGAGTKDPAVKVAPSVTSGRLRRRREAVWKETMEAIVTGSTVDQASQNDVESGIMDLDGPPLYPSVNQGLGASVVNADSLYWRKAVSRPILGSKEHLTASSNV